MILSEREVVSHEPYNAATPLADLKQAITPSRLIYVRNHFNVPELNEDVWRLHVGGSIAQPLALTLDEIQALPSRTMVIILECAGNGRKSMSPVPNGTPWGHGAVSVVEVTGTAFSHVVEFLELEQGVQEFSFQGADRGEVEPGRVVSYVRSLPVDVALHPDTLLVWQMNGRPLTPNHGYPLRLHVPGWYGMAAVKWLTEIHARKHPFEGFFQTEHYTYRQEEGTPEAHPVRLMRVRSLITYPPAGATLESGEIELSGIAWSGGGQISRVEVSVDQGATWTQAELIPAATKFQPTRWKLRWAPTSPGRYMLLSRATDSTGETQPLEQRWNRLGYGNNGVQAVEVILQ